MSGAGHKSIYFPIEQHYTPLKTMSKPARLEEMVGIIREDVRSAERVPLTDLLSSYRRLLIIGEPGGGKTTFLRLIACVLAKDALKQGEPARKLHLGLSLDEPVPIPILIRLSALAGTLKKGVSGGQRRRGVACAFADHGRVVWQRKQLVAEKAA
ncbi:MAG: hypothetical protein JRE64_12365 [Deltaproteobacteria bacterium]|nr:hypothetical protein [Deltaproteobacteria bacterium]